MTKKLVVLFVIVLIFGAGGFFYWRQNPELIWFGKAQVDLTLEEKSEEEVGQGLSEEKVEIVEEELGIEPVSEPEPAQTLTLEELQVMLDDIARQIDMLSQEVAELMEEELEEEGEEKEFAGCQENQLNINVAFIEALEELYRIGPVLAQRIIEERQKELFYTLDDLIRVQGIGEKTVASIKEQGIACAGALEEGLASLTLEQDDEEEEDVEEDTCWVNVNMASVEELQKIIGVGPVIAQRIIEARPFSSLSDLTRVSGIGEITLQKIIAQGCAYASGYTGGGAPPPPASYPKIIISEVQIEGDSTNHDFIELYNSDNSDTDISGYKLRKRTSTGNESSIRVFPSGSLIPAKGYYLWASSKDENYPSLISANASTTQTLASNNSIALLAPDDVVISALAWGSSTSPFMETSPFPDNPDENKSLGRIWLEETEEYKNTGDNSVDFEIQTPTPKAQNQSPDSEPVIEHTLIIEIIGQGTTTPAFGTSTYEKNEEVVVTAFPEEGWRFIGWTGDVVSEEAVIIIVMDGAKQIIANFEKEEPEIEPPTNFLLNEFFEDWPSGGTSTTPPDNWLWSGTAARINQSSDGFVGNYSAELTLTSADWWGFYQYGRTMNSSTTYYAQCWVKGVGVLRLGIKYPGSTYVYYGEVITLNTEEWISVTVSRAPANDGDDGGIKLNVKYDEDQGVSSGSKLIIGAAWLANAPPPDGWLD